ncbi:hypothetical protein SB659_07685 [Arthrobacter sp. SIMBA_036]|uniref:hypothetical protein n=1 Tax=Arthrobacter sp. SIMBA_036 TaxID=3085778 RepID=UPI003977F101
MNAIDGYRQFVRAFPKHRFQQGGIAAYEAALRTTSHAHLMFATRRFATEVRAACPNGKAWKFCPGPARWLAEERYRAYLPEEETP